MKKYSGTHFLHQKFSASHSAQTKRQKRKKRQKERKTQKRQKDKKIEIQND